jgi:hypothetical protein
MVEPLVVTLFPVAFLAVLFAGGQQFRRRHIDMDGTAPISRRLFYSSKYLIVVLWMAFGSRDSCCCSWAGLSWGALFASGVPRKVRACEWFLILQGRGLHVSDVMQNGHFANLPQRSFGSDISTADQDLYSR